MLHHNLIPELYCLPQIFIRKLPIVQQFLHRRTVQPCFPQNMLNQQRIVDCEKLSFPNLPKNILLKCNKIFQQSQRPGVQIVHRPDKLPVRIYSASQSKSSNCRLNQSAFSIHVLSAHTKPASRKSPCSFMILAKKRCVSNDNVA